MSYLFWIRILQNHWLFFCYYQWIISIATKMKVKMRNGIDLSDFEMLFRTVLSSTLSANTWLVEGFRGFYVGFLVKYIHIVEYYCQTFHFLHLIQSLWLVSSCQGKKGRLNTEQMQSLFIARCSDGKNQTFVACSTAMMNHDKLDY